MPLSKKTPGKDKAFAERRRQEGSTAGAVITGKNVFGAGKKGKAALKKNAIKNYVKDSATEKLGISRGLGSSDSAYRKTLDSAARAGKGGVPMQSSGKFVATGGSSARKNIAKRVKQSMDARPELKGKYKP